MNDVEDHPTKHVCVGNREPEHPGALLHPLDMALDAEDPHDAVIPPVGLQPSNTALP